MRTLMIAFAALIAGTSISSADSASTTANIEFSRAVRVSVEMDICRQSDLSAVLDKRLLRAYAVQEAAKISGRDIHEILVEVKGHAHMITSAARRKNILEKFCDRSETSPAIYGKLRLPAEASQRTRETIAERDQLAADETDARLALQLCDLSETDKVKTYDFLRDAKNWATAAVGVRWRDDGGDQEFRTVLETISDKDSVCLAHSEILTRINSHPIYK